MGPNGALVIASQPTSKQSPTVEGSSIAWLRLCVIGEPLGSMKPNILNVVTDLGPAGADICWRGSPVPTPSPVSPVSSVRSVPSAPRQYFGLVFFVFPRFIRRNRTPRNPISQLIRIRPKTGLTVKLYHYRIPGPLLCACWQQIRRSQFQEIRSPLCP